MSLSRLARPLALGASALLVTTLGLHAPAQARAAIAAPTSLAPTGAVASSTPTFSWNRVKGASSYQLVATQDSTQNLLIQQTTSNNRYVQPSNLPDGAVTWQVRAVASAGGFSSWATQSITISPTAAPSLISPSDGEHLTQPDEPPLFTWSPVSGATGYQIQVDNTGTWVSPATYTSSGTSYFVDTPQAPGTWYWRVRAARGNNLYTTWSSGSSYVVDPLDDPQAAPDMLTGQPMQDVRIDWLPVDGAMKYQLQVGRDKDFNNIVDDVTVYGTSYSPAGTYANDQYYWRVRAIDAGFNSMPWTTAQPFVFQRNWPDQPTLEYPLNQFAPTVGDPLFYQWTPVKRASTYQLDVGSDPNFSPGTYNTCTTTGTTFPWNGPCPPMGQGVTTYWRVKGLDYPTGTEGIYSAIHHFVYSSTKIKLLSPDDAATVDVPTLSWQAVPNVQTYIVTIKDKDGNVAANPSTSSTTWTPETALPASGSPYTWTVQAQPAQGAASPLYPGRTFTVSGNLPTDGTPAVPLTSTSDTPTTTTDFPNLTWGAVPGASYYRVRVGVLGSQFYDVSVSHISDATYAYPAAADTGTHYLVSGSYFWYVDAYDNTNHLLAETPSDQYGQFNIADLAAVTGQTVALDGLASQSAGCTNKLSDPNPANQICTSVPATPVLSWNAEPGAAGYLIYLGNDQEFTGRVVNPYASTTNTVWRPPSDLADNTAQDAYYWYVRPCKSFGSLVCNPDPISTHAAATNAFRKQSPAIQLQSPAAGASLVTDPSFSWTDYLDTNQGQDYAGGADASYQTAWTYRIQVSQSSTFSSVVVDTQVDQPFYTPTDKTLPEGTLYWRVQAIDPSGNHVTWSEVRSFSNDLPALDLKGGADTVPANGSSVGGATPFQWTPVDGASSYQIEVYRGDSGTHSPGNLVFSAQTHQSTYVSGSFLPPSSATYTWRVRWLDGDGQPRPWSSDAHFTVSSSTVTLTAPASGTLQKPDDLFFSWDAVPFAASYRIDLRDGNGGITSVSTVATAYAPSTIPDSSWDWRVTAVDPNSNAIAVSSWRPFTVDTQGPVITKFSPVSTGKPTSKIKVTFNEKVIGITGKTFLLNVQGRKSKLPAKLKVAANGQSATLTPKAHLKKGHIYTVTLTTKLHDKAGNHMTSPGVWTFSV